MTEYYSNVLGLNIRDIQFESVFTESDINKILKWIFDGEEGIPKDYWKKTYAKLSDGIDIGYGQTVKTTQDASMVYQLKNNVAVFSAFKANHYAEACRKLLVDENDQPRSWAQFKKEANKLDPTYNQTWLAAEYNLATRQARTAKQWQQFVRDKDVYPNLEWMPSRAANPSDDHQKYYGLVFPINHAFWRAITPGARWGCKCYLTQTRADASDGIDDMDLPEPIPGIEPNSGQTGKVFSASHAFVTAVKKEDHAAIKKELNELKAANENFVQYAVGKYTVSVSTNANPTDVLENTLHASFLAKKHKTNIIVRGNQSVGKNPEFDIKGTIGDLTTWEGADGIYNYIQTNWRAKYQKQLKEFDSVFISFDFNGKLKPADAEPLAQALYGKMKISKRCAYVFLTNNGKSMKVENKDLTVEILLDKINKGLIN